MRDKQNVENVEPLGAPRLGEGKHQLDVCPGWTDDKALSSRHRLPKENVAIVVGDPLLRFI